MGFLSALEEAFESVGSSFGSLLSFVITKGILPLWGGSFGHQVAAWFAGPVLARTLLWMAGGKPDEIKEKQTLNRSPTYSVSASGNTARLGEAIPIIYGRHIIFPDYVTRPYYIYENNDEYFNQVFCIGQGSYTVEDIKIDKTPISSFSQITSEVLKPGSPVTLFDMNIYSVKEVSGQEISQTIWHGPFPVNPPKTTTDQIQIDIIFPSGLYHQTESSGIISFSVIIKSQRREIDDLGVAKGDWVNNTSKIATHSDSTARRYTWSFDVPEGRYEFRLARTAHANPGQNTISNAMNWKSLKSRITSPVHNTYSDLTLLAVKIKATGNLGQNSFNKVNCIVSGRAVIPTSPAFIRPSPRPGDWIDPDSRSIGIVLWNLCKDAGLKDSEIDWLALRNLNFIWDGRGDKFDGIFDSQETLMKALNKVAKVGRAICFVKDGKMRFVRDSHSTDAVASFYPSNIVKNSFGIKLAPINDKILNNGLILKYFSSITWKWEEIFNHHTPRGKSLVFSSKRAPTGNEEIFTLFGCTSEAQAKREAWYIFFSNLYRRCLINFQTGLEALSLYYGDTIGITYPLLNTSNSLRFMEIQRN